MLAGAALAEVPLDMAYVYEKADRNFLLLAAAVVQRVITLKSDAMRNAEQHGNG